jgi:uncharacterized protein
MPERRIEAAVVATPNGVRLRVFAKPRASRSEVLGEKDGAVVVALAAPPVEGAANEELVATLARVFSVPRRSIKLLAGLTGRHKRVEIEGLTLQRVAVILNRS